MSPCVESEVAIVDSDFGSSCFRLVGVLLLLRLTLLFFGLNASVEDEEDEADDEEASEDFRGLVRVGALSDDFEAFPCAACNRHPRQKNRLNGTTVAHLCKHLLQRR